MTPDGRLFAHGDEKATIHEIDPATGEVGKRFFLGNHTARDDFEGIAIVGERFFLISSLGILYEFREGDDREEVAYTRFDTGVGGRCDAPRFADVGAALPGLRRRCHPRHQGPQPGEP